MTAGYYDPISSPQIELDRQSHISRPSPPLQQSSGFSQSSAASTPYIGSDPSQPFIHKTEHSNRQSTIIPHKAGSRKQFWNILLKGLARWVLTVALCVAYVFAIGVWRFKGTVTEPSKRTFNALTTGISIALGLNIATALKDYAMIARWPIMNNRKRNLNELDLTLKADSLTAMAKLAFISGRPMVFIAAIAWLVFNIATQVAVAGVSLTYGFDTSTESYLFSSGTVKVPDMTFFYSQGNSSQPDPEMEQYTAQVLGSRGWQSAEGSPIRRMPRARAVFPRTQNWSSSEYWNIWEDQPNKSMTYVFPEFSAAARNDSSILGIYTDRTISIHYSCNSHKVISNGNGSDYDNPVVQDIGEVYMEDFSTYATTYITNNTNPCAASGQDRCFVVQAFEASDTDPWYYLCNITMGATINDPHNVSFISDRMARTAVGAIAQMGFSWDLQQTTYYPNKTQLGAPLHGNATNMGRKIAAYGLSTISGAATFNPTITYSGMEPHTGFKLTIGHRYLFVLSLFLIPIVQCTMCFIIAFWANRVYIHDDAYLSMSLLLRPIADDLYSVSKNHENSAFRSAKKRMMVRYDLGQDGRWGFARSGH
ncbi:hypothetical protein CJF30_00010435 [Rutstroemia sp. NJR-2017a BBW]|nr:hypothetical protein CJF30_00010435 [Rutstroemia sp. NJR-2017a BBW]